MCTYETKLGVESYVARVIEQIRCMSVVYLHF